MLFLAIRLYMFSELLFHRLWLSSSNSIVASFGLLKKLDSFVLINSSRSLSQSAVHRIVSLSPSSFAIWNSRFHNVFSKISPFWSLLKRTTGSISYLHLHSTLRCVVTLENTCYSTWTYDPLLDC